MNPPPYQVFWGSVWYNYLGVHVEIEWGVKNIQQLAPWESNLFQLSSLLEPRKPNWSALSVKRTCRRTSVNFKKSIGFLLALAEKPREVYRFFHLKRMVSYFAWKEAFARSLVSSLQDAHVTDS